MNGPKYTPGPWEVYPPSSERPSRWVVGSAAGNICDVGPNCGQQPDNARLIAASPRLVAALDALVRLLNGPADFTTQQITDAIRAGIEALQDAGVYE